MEIFDSWLPVLIGISILLGIISLPFLGGPLLVKATYSAQTQPSPAIAAANRPKPNSAAGALSKTHQTHRCIKVELLESRPVGMH